MSLLRVIIYVILGLLLAFGLGFPAYGYALCAVIAFLIALLDENTVQLGPAWPIIGAIVFVVFWAFGIGSIQRAPAIIAGVAAAVAFILELTGWTDPRPSTAPSHR